MPGYCLNCPCESCLAIRAERSETQRREDERAAASRELNRERGRRRREGAAFRTAARLIVLSASDTDRRAISKILVAKLREIDALPAGLGEVRFALPQLEVYTFADGRSLCEAFMLRLDRAGAIHAQPPWQSFRLDDALLEEDFKPAGERREERRRTLTVEVAAKEAKHD